MSTAYVYVGSRSEVIGAAIVWTESKRMEDIHFMERAWSLVEEDATKIIEEFPSSLLLRQHSPNTSAGKNSESHNLSGHRHRNKHQHHTKQIPQHPQTERYKGRNTKWHILLSKSSDHKGKKQHPTRDHTSDCDRAACHIQVLRMRVTEDFTF